MKTPREILLAHHRVVESKLDAIRRKVVWKGRRAAVPKFRVADTAALPMLLWRELIWPCRRVWAGLAAVWVVILLVNFSARDPELVAGKSPPPTREMILTFQQQEKLLAELTGPSEPRVAAPAKPFSPRPSSERRFEALTA